MTAGDTKYEDRFVDNYEARNPDLSFYVEVGFIFVFDSELPDVDELILNCIEKLCNHNWSWSYDDFTIFAPDEKGKSVMPDGTRVMATDVRRRVWIHFDSKDDAMLSRITVVDLRSAKHADGGRLPTGTGPTLD